MKSKILLAVVFVVLCVVTRLEAVESKKDHDCCWGGCPNPLSTAIHLAEDQNNGGCINTLYLGSSTPGQLGTCRDARHPGWAHEMTCGMSTGCNAKGKAMCPNSLGGHNQRNYDLTCPTGQNGEIPQMGVDSKGAYCLYENGMSSVATCRNGEIGYMTYWQ